MGGLGQPRAALGILGQPWEASGSLGQPRAVVWGPGGQVMGTWGVRGAPTPPSIRHFGLSLLCSPFITLSQKHSHKSIQGLLGKNTYVGED